MPTFRSAFRMCKGVKLRPNTKVIDVPAGHCPQDEIPEIVNPIIQSFMTTLDDIF